MSYRRRYNHRKYGSSAELRDSRSSADWLLKVRYEIACRRFEIRGQANVWPRIYFLSPTSFSPLDNGQYIWYVYCKIKVFILITERHTIGIPKKRNAYTLIELLIVVTLLTILLTFALPSYIRARIATKRMLCLNNLRQIEAAVDRWVFENDIPDGSPVSYSDEDEVYSYVGGGRLTCPSGGEYVISSIGAYPQVTCNMEGHGSE